MRESFCACATLPVLGLLRKALDPESRSTESLAISVAPDILFRLVDGFNFRVFRFSLSVNLRFFAVPCPGSRSEALRLVAGVVAEAAFPFLSVACSFFQLLDKLVKSIPIDLGGFPGLLHCEGCGARSV